MSSPTTATAASASTPVHGRSGDERLRTQPAARRFLAHDVSSLDTQAVHQRFQSAQKELAAAQSASLRKQYPGDGEDQHRARLATWTLMYPSTFGPDRCKDYIREMCRLLPNRFTMDVHATWYLSHRKPPRHPSPRRRVATRKRKPGSCTPLVPIAAFVEDEIDHAAARLDISTVPFLDVSFDHWVADRRAGTKRRSPSEPAVPPPSPLLPPPLIDAPRKTSRTPSPVDWKDMTSTTSPCSSLSSTSPSSASASSSPSAALSTSPTVSSMAKLTLDTPSSSSPSTHANLAVATAPSI